MRAGLFLHAHESIADIADYDKKAGSAHDPTLSAKAKSEIRTEIKKAVGQFVAVRVQEMEKLKNEKDAANAAVKLLEKKLAKEKYVSKTLKARQKPRKGRH